jgi:hypothetical protein
MVGNKLVTKSLYLYTFKRLISMQRYDNFGVFVSRIDQEKKEKWARNLLPD